MSTGIHGLQGPREPERGGTKGSILRHWKPVAGHSGVVASGPKHLPLVNISQHRQNWVDLQRQLSPTQAFAQK